MVKQSYTEKDVQIIAFNAYLKGLNNAGVSDVQKMLMDYKHNAKRIESALKLNVEVQLKEPPWLMPSKITVYRKT